MKVFRYIILLLALLFMLATMHGASAQGPCGDTYVVQPGDTLSGIAVICETTVTDILEANPAITDPTRLFIGQRLRIPPPEEEEEQPVILLSPACGPPGEDILVEGRSFPANVIVELEVGEQTAPAIDFTLIERLRTDENGRFQSQETIPSSAQPGENWIIVAVVRAGGPRIEIPSDPFFVTSPGPGRETTTYIVQPGDTLDGIADRFGTNAAGIMEANPEIVNPRLIFVGQRLIIPGQAERAPSVTISPTCGPAETEVQAVVSNFPENSRVEIRAGVFEREPDLVIQDITDGQGELQTNITIPDTAERNQPWVVTVETVAIPRTRASSTIFTVTRSQGATVATAYIVQPGDTLIEVAARSGISTQRLFAANPDIANLNQLTVGQRLRIPGQVESVTILPLVGPPGTNVRVEVENFPSNTQVEIGVGRSSTDFSVVESELTDANGDITTQVSIPTTARPNERWLVVAVATPGRLEIKAASDFFSVTGIEPAEGKIVTLWPQQGRSGSTVFVVAAGFPRYTPAEIKLGRVGESLDVVENTVTDINGTLSAQVSIPPTAEANQEWVVVIATTKSPSLEATSPVFLVMR